MPEPVIFLDFDGVICSPRAFVAQEGRWAGEQRALRWADQVACDMVWQLLTKHNAKLVISSTWRFIEDNCHKVLGRYKLTPFLHVDWRTGNDPERIRWREVGAWLDINGNPPFIILDDDADFTPEQMPWLVNTCSLNGMMLHDYHKADKLLASFAPESSGEHRSPSRYRNGKANTWARGAANPKAKLTPEQVQEIAASSGSSRIVAERYGVHPTTVQRIRSGSAWTTR